MAPPRGRRAPTPVPTSSEGDVAAHLLREHSLLEMLAARMHEVAAAMAAGEPVARDTVGRGLDLHRDLLIATHQKKDDWLVAALRPKATGEERNALAVCEIQHPLAEAFQNRCRPLLEKWNPVRGKVPASLAAAWEAEAERIQTHDHFEEEEIYHGPVGRLTLEQARELLRRFGTLRASSIATEARLSQWSSEEHPASD